MMLNPVREILPSGVTLLALPLVHSAVVTADIWVRSGARTEPKAYQGISHFLEHLVFKGTETLAPGSFDSFIESRGGMTNAATSMDFTHYYITVAAPDIGECLPLLADLVCNAAIPDKEFGPERLVVLEEIRRAQDSPDRHIYQTLVQTLYGDHPYSRPVLGHPENLQDLTAEKVRAFHRERYHPQAMTVILAGGLPVEHLLAIGRETFADLATPALPTPYSAPSKPLHQSQRLQLAVPRLQQNRLLLAWLGPDIGQLEDGVALEMASTMLTTGRTSRLVKLLREEKGWARHIYSNFALQHDPGLFTISAQVGTDHLEPTEQVILQEVQALIAGTFSEQELERARKLLLSEFIFGTETPSQTAMLYGYYQTVADLDTLRQYRHLLNTLDASAIQRATRRYLNATPTTLVFTPV